MISRFYTGVWLKNDRNQSLRKLGFDLYICLQISFLLIVSSYAKFELNSLKNNEITMKVLTTDIFGCHDKAKVRNDVIFKQLNNGFDVMNYFAKFEKFLPHSIIIPSFMTIGSQMPELDWGEAFLPAPSYKIGRQNTPYKKG